MSGTRSEGERRAGSGRPNPHGGSPAVDLRRRIALFICPDLGFSEPLEPLEPLAPSIAFTFDPHHQTLHEIAESAERIAREMERLNARRRRPRNVWCEHPELHPELAK